MEIIDPIARRPLVPAFVWIAVLVLSIPLTGFARVDLPWLIYIAVTLAIVGLELLFLHLLYREGKKGLYLGWKKFSGYVLPVFYFAHALPRVTWEKAGLISGGRATFIFAITLIATLAGGLLFFLASRPATLVAFGIIQADEVKDAKLRKQRGRERQAASHKRNFLLAALEWVDALAWAAIAVLIVNIFVFQLYVVPSESMVPAFLVGDRPFTLKLASGPRIPLTEWRLPWIRLPQRGDIITIANPRYDENNGVDLKKYLSQLVYMLSFTVVKLDSTLPDGTPKADPLVKRITGVPGERLMMVDDQLYVRRRGDTDWKPVSETWARADLWKESAALKKKIQSIPVDEETRGFLKEMDSTRIGSDPTALSTAISMRILDMEVSLSKVGPDRLASFNAAQLRRAPPTVTTARDEAIAAAGKGLNPFAEAGVTADDFPLALAAASDARTRDALFAYARGAIASATIPPADAYDRGARSLSLIIKRNLLDRIAVDLELVAQGADISAFGSDARLTVAGKEAQRLYWYLLRYWDTRNFPAFPGKDSYLGPSQYFAMGDNRYNSLDFRFREASPHQSPLDPADPAPVMYSSMLDLFPLELDFIEGVALFRLWPFTRFGKI
jgi:signal peptidase I